VHGRTDFLFVGFIAKEVVKDDLRPGVTQDEPDPGDK